MSEDRQREMTTRDYLRLLWRRKWPLLAVLGGCVCAAALYNALATPVYEGRAELVVRSEAAVRPSILAAAAPLLSLLGEQASLLGGDLSTQVQMVSSRPCLEQAYALVHEQPALLQRLQDRGLSDEDLLALPATLERLPEAPPPSLWVGEYERMLDTLLVSGIEDSQVIEVRCESADRKLAADFINALALAYLGRSLADAQAAARRVRDYVQEELADTEPKLEDAEERLRRFGEDTGTVALETAAEQQIGLLARLDEAAAAAEAKMQAQAALQGELMAQLGTQEERVIAATVTTRNPEIVELQKALAAAEAERVGLLEEYTEESPPVRQATAKSDELRRRLAETAAEVVGSQEETLNPVALDIIKQLGLARGEHLAGREALRVTKGAIRRVEAALSEMPAEQLELLRLQREVALLEKIYLALKEKEQEYEIAEKTKMPVSSLVEQAIPAEEPLRPKQVLNLVAALVAGVLLGLLLVGLVEHFDESFAEPEAIAAELGLPVLAVFGGGRWWEAGGEAPGEAADAVLRYVVTDAREEGGPAVGVLVAVDEGWETRLVAEVLLGRVRQRGMVGVMIVSEGPGLRELAAGEETPKGDTPEVMGLGEGGIEGLSAAEVERALQATGADLVTVVSPPGSAAAGLGALLRGGWPVLMVVALRRTRRARATRLARLLRDLGARLRGVISTAGRRCESEYDAAPARGERGAAESG